MHSIDWNKKGEEHWQNDRIQDALSAFQEATKLDPNNAEALYNEGAALVSLSRNEEGLKVISHAIRLKPEDVVGLVWKAIAEYRQGEKDLALETINQAVELDPQERFAQLVKAYIDNDQEIVL